MINLATPPAVHGRTWAAGWRLSATINRSRMPCCVAPERRRETLATALGQRVQRVIKSASPNENIGGSHGGAITAALITKNLSVKCPGHISILPGRLLPKATTGLSKGALDSACAPCYDFIGTFNLPLARNAFGGR